jgi:hypothetical protein
VSQGVNDGGTGCCSDSPGMVLGSCRTNIFSSSLGFWSWLEEEMSGHTLCLLLMTPRLTNLRDRRPASITPIIPPPSPQHPSRNSHVPPAVPHHPSLLILTPSHHSLTLHSFHHSTPLLPPPPPPHSIPSPRSLPSSSVSSAPVLESFLAAPAVCLAGRELFVHRRSLYFRREQSGKMMLFVRAWLVLGERVIEMEAEIEMV